VNIEIISADYIDAFFVSFFDLKQVFIVLDVHTERKLLDKHAAYLISDILCTYRCDLDITSSMGHMPSSETNNYLSIPEFPYILGSTEVHHSVKNSHSPDPILSQLNPVHALTPCFF